MGKLPVSKLLDDFLANSVGKLPSYTFFRLKIFEGLFDINYHSENYGFYVFGKFSGKLIGEIFCWAIYIVPLVRMKRMC